ncbi:hypothetical protein Sa4125_00390 [Aureimonas sp. SA4125]|uniref:hypothetical protein n=1 Tax=Aureimonas sp. SA4125 TaxID=2826993 RepID=UPI001CC6A093|nr:hypothetical protein [Aureimonas sp. SA4125]BDA82497.1 hypothetical protein Sa4125_00390 [Aureimonas sp. SA4125]
MSVGHRRRRARLPAAVLAEAASVALVADGYDEPKLVEGLFAPASRGALVEAFADGGSFDRVAPETPRPAEMLETVTVSGGASLTAQDLALHEFLVASAYEAALAASEAGDAFRIVGREMRIPMRWILRFLGPSVRRTHVLKSLAALRSTTVSYGLSGGRRYTDVPMLVGWAEEDASAGSDVVAYSLPSPVWHLMAVQPRYAYLELAALAGMGTRYGIYLYRRLALRTNLEKWTLDETPLRIELTPEDAASWIGYEARPIVASRLTTTLKRAVQDMGSVRRFQVEWCDPVTKPGRGAPVARYALSVTLRPPGRHEVQPVFVDRAIVPVVGGMDVPEYQVSDVVWRKIDALARRQRVFAHHAYVPDAWFVALQEALVGTPVTNDFGKREYRGHALMEAIRKLTADEAAYRWAVEELRNPDLILLSEAVGSDRAAELTREAKRARFERVNDRRFGVDRKKRHRPERRTLEVQADRAKRAREERAAERRRRWPEANVIYLEMSRPDDPDREVARLRRHRWSGDTLRLLRIRYSVGPEFVMHEVGGVPATLDDVEAFLTGDDRTAWTAHYVADPRLLPATPVTSIKRKIAPSPALAEDEPQRMADWESDYLFGDIEAPDAIDFDDDMETTDDIPF